jgi:hypothetical protein
VRGATPSTVSHPLDILNLLTKGTTMTPMELIIIQINNLVEAKEKGRITQSEWDMQLISVVSEYKVAVLDQVK